MSGPCRRLTSNAVIVCVGVVVFVVVIVLVVIVCNLLGVSMEIRVERAVQETCWGFSVPDFPAGTGAGVHKG